MNEHFQEAEVINLEERRRVRQATGGNGPPAYGANWLAELPNGTRFIAKEKARPGSELDDFVITTPPNALGDIALLAKNIKGRDGVFEWHDPKLFSQNYKLYCVMEVLEINGSNQQIPEGRLAGDDKPPKPAEVHDGE